MQSMTLRLRYIAGLLILLAPWYAQAASKVRLDARINAAIKELHELTASGKELAEKSAGMLVFPHVSKAGIGVGGERVTLALLIEGKIADYYTTTSVSIGFQLGAQVKRQVILFMNKDALESFRNSSGWEVGVDASVAIATLGAGGEIDTEVAKEPVIGFIFGNTGLMFNLTLEGSKISKKRNWFSPPASS